ncbi:MAG: rod shape-determining protein MreC [Candidatus Omnitrophica bacterium]|nr:rod shape-determining protein MreC [Candidatus Omnitrophota bacterium]
MRLRPSHYWIAIVLLPVILVAFNPQISPAVHNLGDTLLKPVFSLMSGLGFTVVNIRDGFANAWKSFQDQAGLEEKIEGLERQLEAAKETDRENSRLKKLLEFKETQKVKTIPARVVGWDISPWRKMIILDRGQSAGIRKDMSVVVAEGLVGRVFETGPHTARVLILLDPESRVSALASESRAQGVAEGDGSELLTLEYLDLDARVELGESVLTSGATTLFAKGLLIGKIQSIAKAADGLHLAAQIKPAVSFKQLEEVLCLASSHSG